MADDGFDMFGSDDEEEEEDAVEEGEGDKHEQEAVALFLSTFFLKSNPQVKLTERVVGIANPGSTSAFEHRGFSLISLSESDVPSPLHLDAIIVWQGQADGSILNNLLPGGVLILPTENSFIKEDKDFLPSAPIDQSNQFISRVKRPVLAHTSTCPWLPGSFSHATEQEHLEQATVTLSAHEVQTSRMTETSQSRAVTSLQEYGYVVIRSLMNVDDCKKWGSAVLESVHAAAETLLKNEHVNILEPQNSEREPQSYREVCVVCVGGSSTVLFSHRMYFL